MGGRVGGGGGGGGRIRGLNRSRGVSSTGPKFGSFLRNPNLHYTEQGPILWIDVNKITNLKGTKLRVMVTILEEVDWGVEGLGFQHVEKVQGFGSLGVQVCRVLRV